MSDERDDLDRNGPVNPFPGPQPYRSSDRERFHGREAVGRELASTILAHRCVALFGPSGAGKSSVMQAAVIPELEEDFDFRRATIDGWPSGEDPVAWLLYKLNAQLKLVAPDTDLGLYESVEWTVRQAFRRSDRPILIYLDQFEQLLLPHRDVASVEAFLDWLDRFAQRPIRGLHLVLAMREDYLGRFRDRARGRRRLLENGFRLGPMTVGEIVGAVCLAAADGLPAQAWAPAPMRALMLQVRVPGQSETDSAEVQTAFAQIVCRALFAERAGQGAVAVAESVHAEPMLHRYLENTLESLGALREPAERLLEDHLIATDGTRSLLTEDAARAAGLLVGSHLNTVLTTLEEAAILRAEQHRGTRYFEIGHDWLAKRVHDRKQERIVRAAEFQRQREHEAEQRMIQAQLQAARAETRRARIVVAIVATLGLLALVLGVYAWDQRTAANTEADRARAAEVAAVDANAELVKAKEAAELSGDRAREASKEALEQQARAKDAEITAKNAEIAAKNEKANAELDKVAAERSEKKAKAATRNAKQALNDAEMSRDRAHDANLLTVALSVMANDPTTALALLLEIKDPLATRGWTPATIEALERPVSQAVLRGHDGYVVAARFSPDGEFVATASHDHSARVSRVDGTGRPVPLQGHSDRVVDLAFSPDGKRVATASVDGTVRLSQRDGTGKAQTIDGSGRPLVALAFSPDGKHIAFGATDGSVHVFTVDGATKPQLLAGHKAAVRSLTFSPNNERLVTTSDDGTARVWPVKRQGTVVVLSGHKGTVHAASFSADSTRVVTAGDDRTARVWPAGGAAAGTELVLKDHTDAVNFAEFDSTGERVVTASSDRTARVWTLKPTVASTVLEDHDDKVYVARFAPKGTTVVTVSLDGTARIWPEGGSDNSRVLRGHTAPVVGAEFSRDGGRIVTAAEDGTARVWEVAPAYSQVIVVPVHGATRFASFSEDGRRIITASNNGSVRVWALSETGAQLEAILREHKDGAIFADFGPGKTIYTGANDGKFRIWRLAAGRAEIVQSVALALSGPPEFIALSPDHRRLLTTATDIVTLIDIHNDSRTTLPRSAGDDARHRGPVRHAAFSPDGTRIVTASDDHTARVWSSDGGLVATLSGHEGSLYHAAFNHDGRKIVTASWDRTARVWNADGKGAVVVLSGHKTAVRSAEFSHDGARIVTGSDDGIVRLWQADGTGDVIQIHGHKGTVYHAAFSPEGDRIVTVGSDRSARIWPVNFGDPEQLRTRIKAATTVCLVPEQRVLLLGEIANEANEKYRKCEADLGRKTTEELQP